jgi:hypothetical protein
MDWGQIVQLTIAAAAGAAGQEIVRRMIRDLKRQPASKPLQIDRLEQYSLSQEKATDRLAVRLDDLEDRIRDVERTVSRISSRAASTSGSTD